MTEKDNSPVRYIIVVHGIGEQRKNETVLSVINRFAEIRWAKKHNPSPDLNNLEKSELLTLGRASAQTGKEFRNRICQFPIEKENFNPWIEFEGIPQKPDGEIKEPFFGKLSENGENLRFVDCCWADILQDDWPRVGQDTAVWAKGLLGRLKLKNESIKQEQIKPGTGSPVNNNVPAPTWVVKILEKLAETLVFLQKIMSFRVKNFEDLIFNKFLGDAQLYGEHLRTRGKAVRRFHNLIAKVEKAHKNDKNVNCREARYTIIAHSLGSIMSADALMYAHARDSIRKTEGSPIKNIPFLGYRREFKPSLLDTGEGNNASDENNAVDKNLVAEADAKKKEVEEQESCPDTDWINRTDAFVTLGSPIDKYFTMWWLNYQYTLDTSWIGEEVGRLPGIAHYNYCDELDPVGGELDIAHKSKAFDQIFENREDLVFNRYSVPGAAHNEYWNDEELFGHILDNAVDNVKPRDRKDQNEKKPNKKEAPEPEKKQIPVFKDKEYKKALSWIYRIIPYSVILLEIVVFLWAVHAPKIDTTIIASFLFFGVCLLGKRVLDLVIYWRQILRKKCDHQWTLIADRQEELVKERFDIAGDFKFRLKWVPAVHLTISGIFLGILFAFKNLEPAINTGPIKNVMIIAAVALVGIFLYQAFIRKTLSGSNTKEDPPGISEVIFSGDMLKLYGFLSIPVAGGFAICFMVLKPGDLEAICELYMKVFGGDPKGFFNLVFNLTSIFSIVAIVFTYFSIRFYAIRSEVEKIFTSDSTGETK